MPGVLTTDRPCFRARPERGWTNAAYPGGSAIAMPVGTSARSPGASVTSTVVRRSAPASPGLAYVGNGSSASSRVMLTSTMLATIPASTEPS